MPRGDVENLHGLTQQSFTGSALFERTFDEGMALVEETARYLDGKGREESRDLPRKAAMLYAGESMRVTTRLMQAASWLLVQRAVHDGDMEADAARAATAIGWAPRKSAWARRRRRRDLLPERCSDLLVRSDNLYRRIARLDDVLFGDGASGAAPARAAQLDRLEQAFGAIERASFEVETKKAARRTAFFVFDVKPDQHFTKPGELLVEAGQPAAAVHQLLLAAGPGRVGGGVDVERDLLARLAIGGAGLIGRAVVQLNVDEMIGGMDALFHGNGLFRLPEAAGL